MTKRFMLALAVFLTATSPGSLAGARHTGIQGKAFLYISYGPLPGIEPQLGITYPSVQLPVETAFTVLSSKTGREITRVTTDPTGAFALPLHPGKYMLAPDPLMIAFGCYVLLEPIEVVVSRSGFTTVNIVYFKQGPCPVGPPIRVP